MCDVSCLTDIWASKTQRYQRSFFGSDSKMISIASSHQMVYTKEDKEKKKRKKKKRKHYEFLFLQDWTCMFRCKLLHSSIIKIRGDICFIQPTKLQTSACFNQPIKLLFITKVAAFFCNSGYICFTWMFSANQIYI